MSVRQQRRHAKLRVARQNPDHRLQFSIEPIELAYLAQCLFGHLIAQRIRDNDNDLLILAPVFSSLPPVEIHLTWKARDRPVREASHLILPGIVQLQHEIRGVAVLDRFIERG